MSIIFMCGNGFGIGFLASTLFSLDLIKANNILGMTSTLDNILGIVIGFTLMCICLYLSLREENASK